MEKHKGISLFYYLSAAYDGILGLAFLIFPITIYTWHGITPPNHVGYVQFPAALLVVFAIMFINIGRQPIRNRKLIPYGILLKISYCSVVFVHWFTTGIPDMWKSFAIFDLIFGIVFVWTYLHIGKELKEN
ncbi:MAG: hypothetical protein QNK40_13810 [Desulfobacterales bacterium]|nr:hypothetical protein [Desulfobacterales bacterium]